MRVSHNWLKTLVEISINPEELGEMLSMAGFEVEEIDDKRTYAEGVVIGFVKECDQHPNADKLSLCQVDIGEEDLLQIVCGASNIKKGVHVPVAVVGCRLAAINLEIKPSEIRGVKSNGMICALQELGIPSETNNGIFIFEEHFVEELKVGSPVNCYLGLDDVIYDIAVTANRPDGLSMYGIAQEVSCLLSTSTLFGDETYDSNHSSLKSTNFSKEAIDNNSIYTISLYTGADNNARMDQHYINSLKASKINTNNPIVDITNYIMLEQGQPLHAFDADLLENLIGGVVTGEDFGIRQANKNEKFITLDNNNLSLNSDTIVVTCKDIPIAIAGVIGGLNSCVSAKTTRFWIEAASFSQKAIRNSCRSINIRSEASSRFEKGVESLLTLFAVSRASILLNTHLGARKENTWVFKPSSKDREPILLRRNRIHKILGPLCQGSQISILSDKENATSSFNKNTQLKDEVITNIITATGCHYQACDEGWLVKVPLRRRIDLTREIDLIEEIARLIGYDNFESHLPNPIKPGILLPSQKNTRILQNSLVSLGFNEVCTTSLVSPIIKETEQVKINNPFFSEASCLRTNMWKEHLDIIERNHNSGIKGCWLFEIGNIFKMKEGTIEQLSILSGVLSSDKTYEIWSTNGKRPELRYFSARGILQQGLNSLKVQVQDNAISDNSELHPGRSSKLTVEGKRVGIFGQVHPSVCDKKGIPRDTYMFELNMDLLITSSTRNNKFKPQYKSFSTFPSIERDLTMVIAKDINCKTILEAIRKNGKPHLENVELIDQYQGKGIDVNNISQTYRLKYRSNEKTLAEADIKPIHEKIRLKLNEIYKAELRS